MSLIGSLEEEMHIAKRNVPTVVFGPKACGKTRNKEALRQITGCDRVFDDWYGQRSLPRGNVLVLTFMERDEIARRAGRDHVAIPFSRFNLGRGNGEA